LRGAKGTLLGLSKLLIIRVLRDDSSIELWLKWIDVEEGVLPVVYLSGWHAIQTLEALVSNGWEIHICTLLCDLNTLEPINKLICKSTIEAFTYSASWKL
jgi:hypothetical protein